MGTQILAPPTVYLLAIHGILSAALAVIAPVLVEVIAVFSTPANAILACPFGVETRPLATLLPLLLGICGVSIATWIPLALLPPLPLAIHGILPATAFSLALALAIQRILSSTTTTPLSVLIAPTCNF